jgi:hypothetical protein
VPVRVGDVVRILPEFYLRVAPLPVGVVERIDLCGAFYQQFLVGFAINERKLWMTAEDVEVVGHVDGN